MHLLTIVATDLEAVGAMALIRPLDADLPIVDAHRWTARIALQQQLVLLRQAIDPAWRSPAPGLVRGAVAAVAATGDDTRT